MTSPEAAAASGNAAHDPELARFLEQVTELAALRQSGGPEVFVERLGELTAQFRELRKYRTDRALSPNLEAYAGRRFELVDDAHEYALAGAEVLVLSMVLGDAAALMVPALKRSVIILSGVLAEDGVTRLFGQLLKRLRELTRETGDVELRAWVTGVADILPGD